MNQRNTPTAPMRRGMALPLVLICIAIAMSLGAVSISVITHHHRNTRRIEKHNQVLWLADSAVQRALFKLNTSPDYLGETWTISAEELGNSDQAQVSIEIRPADNEPAGRVLVVEARCPLGGPQTIVQRRLITLPDQPAAVDETESE